MQATLAAPRALARQTIDFFFSFFFFVLKNFSFSFLQGGSNACGTEMHQLSANQWEGSGWQHSGGGEVGGALQH